MKITLFTHNAVIGKDAPLCHKSQSYIDDLITKKEARMLPAGAYRRPAAILTTPRTQSEQEQYNDNLMAAAHETSVNASISAAEMEANAGIADTKGATLRAQAKVKAWMSKDTRDERSPLPRGSWINPVAIQVHAVQ